MRAIALWVLATFALAGMLPAQSPMIVQAATQAVTSSQAPATAENSGSIQAALKMLQEMKAANEETLRKQAATLEQLDMLEKEAEQIKIYSKRG
jgi:endonuclease/exonuclease/phosphatase (EEP) superfamily protein YafD